MAFRLGNARLRRAVMQRRVRPWSDHGRESELAKQDAEMQKPMNLAGQATCPYSITKRLELAAKAGRFTNTGL